MLVLLSPMSLSVSSLSIVLSLSVILPILSFPLLISIPSIFFSVSIAPSSSFRHFKGSLDLLSLKSSIKSSTLPIVLCREASQSNSKQRMLLLNSLLIRLLLELGVEHLFKVDNQKQTSYSSMEDRASSKSSIKVIKRTSQFYPLESSVPEKSKTNLFH